MKSSPPPSFALVALDGLHHALSVGELWKVKDVRWCATHAPLVACAAVTCRCKRLAGRQQGPESQGRKPVRSVLRSPGWIAGPGVVSGQSALLLLLLLLLVLPSLLLLLPNYQVEMILRIWRRFRSAGLVASQPVAFNNPLQSATYLPPTAFTSSIVEALHQFRDVSLGDADDIPSETRSANFLRFRVNCLCVCAFLHCGRREAQVAKMTANNPFESIGSNMKESAAVPPWFRVASFPNQRYQKEQTQTQKQKLKGRNQGWILSGIGDVKQQVGCKGSFLF